MGSERAYQFFRLVERMRDKQKEYFRTRSAAVLNESKQLERDVDKEIQRVNNVLDNRQPSLFGVGVARSEDWYINSVWHKAEELPQPNAWLLAQIGNDSFDTFIMAVEADRWKRWCKGLNIVRWAYIEDLLPNTED